MKYRDDDPPEQSYPPEEKITRVTLTAELRDNCWSIACPQWNCEIPDKSLTRGAAIILAEIENHNKEIDMEGRTEPNYSTTPRDAHRNRKVEGRYCDCPTPDDGTMTPNRNIYIGGGFWY